MIDISTLEARFKPDVTGDDCFVTLGGGFSGFCLGVTGRGVVGLTVVGLGDRIGVLTVLFTLLTGVVGVLREVLLPLSLSLLSSTSLTHSDVIDLFLDLSGVVMVCMIKVEK